MSSTETWNVTVIENMSEASTGAEQPLSFEAALRALEAVVDTLETGNVPLEQLVALLRRGLSLADQCDATLATAEATLEELLATADGELVTRRVSPAAEDAEDGAAASGLEVSSRPL